MDVEPGHVSVDRNKGLVRLTWCRLNGDLLEVEFHPQDARVLGRELVANAALAGTAGQIIEGEVA